ncbi:hypothetical protein GS518_00310 [Leptospira interrogans]|uniref:Uncharacterized protein n=2 Tax=Leptospira interrogans TaxID=173 RepID=Q72W75_LEPIC|nr:hypothetical protein [Leptospira interrogans]KAA1268608.1 hypothetical protein C5473_11925 [Leptospira interrogans serovar Weerasinghe]KAA1290660.1 hypothetical protein C4X99_09975 [Leptospira interrogans serovar Geyaweera]AAS68699.1 conserved hypothetical protein [Leptospira interrogans serovar Copenhageni str. Fiocruz L1-130]ARB96156.1 hypothetical protein A6J42_12160 [Leptospira interrogans serovar Copenhageni]ASP41055.1 hypothetical protein AMR47_00440 [Leptospira interrogans]
MKILKSSKNFSFSNYTDIYKIKYREFITKYRLNAKYWHSIVLGNRSYRRSLIRNHFDFIIESKTPVAKVMPVLKE